MDIAFSNPQKSIKKTLLELKDLLELNAFTLVFLKYVDQFEADILFLKGPSKGTL
jgi:hypothetical protein